MNVMKNIFFAALAVMLTSCATGKLVNIPLSMPGGETATIIAHNQTAPDWMLSTKALKLNFIVKGNVNDQQLAAIAAAEGACRIYTKVVRPNTLVAVASSGVLYAATGYLGTGGGATLGFNGAKFAEYGKYGGMAYGFGGIANGLISGGGKTYTFENCGREIFALFPGYQVQVLEKSPY